MKRYAINQFDRDTFIVIDRDTRREICICGNYLTWKDAKKRAQQIATALNNQSKQNMPVSRDLLTSKRTNRPSRISTSAKQ